MQRLMGLLRRSGLGLVCDPHTGPLQLPVQQMLAAGVTVCLGQDDINDAHYAYGRNNMVQVALCGPTADTRSRHGPPRPGGRLARRR